MRDDEWQSLLNLVGEIQEWFPDGVAFIGGIAVYSHMVSDEETAPYGAHSHDADFMILLPEFVDLRDIEALTPNRRLGKQQFVKGNFEFDVYVENQTDLVIPVPEVVAFSEVKNGIRVACAEHLLILKAVALADRKGSPKGAKDEDDIVRILLATKEIKPDRIIRATQEMADDIEAAAKGDASMRLAGGNAHLAKQIRSKIQGPLDQIRVSFNRTYGA